MSKLTCVNFKWLEAGTNKLKLVLLTHKCPKLVLARIRYINNIYVGKMEHTCKLYKNIVLQDIKDEIEVKLFGKNVVEKEMPDFNMLPLQNVDATPNKDLSIRILKSYRTNYDCVFVTEENNPLIALMNEQQEKRANLLDKAIKVLEENKERL